MRWDPYVLVEPAGFDAFWTEHLRGRRRDVLFLVGRGFDVRALDAPRRIVAAGGSGRRDVWLFNFAEAVANTDDHRAMTERNMAELERLFASGVIEHLEVRRGDRGQRGATSRSTKRALSDKEGVEAYDDVIVDISAMPRMVAMTSIAKLTHLLDAIWHDHGRVINLHVVTAESVASDRSVTGGTLSDVVSNVVGFSGRLTGETDEHLPRIWFPVLGERQDQRLRLIREELRPDEICPVIPFPSREARRGDEIVGAYRQLLFEEFNVEPRNILHACEFNPFEAYKQLYAAIDRYRDALRELDGCKAFVSPLSSKLLSVGALLACYDHVHDPAQGGRLFVGMHYVETAAYGPVQQGADVGRELYAMWIRGEWEL